MLPSINLDTVSVHTPDGRALFGDLTLSFGPGRTGLVGRNGVGKSTLLHLLAGERQPHSGSVSRTGTVGRLRQRVQVPAGTTVADALGIGPALAVLSRLEAGQGTAEDAAAADWTLEARLGVAMADLDIGHIPPDRPLVSLSGGERTRVDLAALLLAGPDFILLDEPTNNLDAGGRAAVAQVLDRWRGGAIVVSHDRALLRGMDRIVELTPRGARVYGGGWDAYAARREVQREAAERRLSSAETELDRIERERRRALERRQKRTAGGRRSRARGGMPKIVMNARRDQGERTAARGEAIGEARRDAALGEIEAARRDVVRDALLSVSLAPTGLPAGRTVLAFDNVSVSLPGRGMVLENVDFEIVGPERIAVLGANGSGKTTLLKLADGTLAPDAGTVRRGSAPVLSLDQQVAILDPALSLRDNFRHLNPDDDENACRAALARFLFRADAALRPAGELSGGEMLRAGLACTLAGARPPQLLILDEPTNHLDLASLEAIEAALRGYDGALLVVSHDRDFLEAVGISRALRVAGGWVEEARRPSSTGPSPMI